MKTIRCVLFLILLSSCASTDLKPITSASYVQEEDERRIWKLTNSEFVKFNKSPYIYNAPELEAYLNEVAHKIMHSDIYENVPFWIRVVRNNKFNAFAVPNGSIYVNLGVLASIENESQLATLLAHEMTHSTHRHAVRTQRDIMNKTAALSTFSVIAGGIGVDSWVINLSALLTYSSIFGYSRELETEADMEGIERVAQGGYDIREAAKLFAIMKDDLEEMNKKSEGAPYFFSTHPALLERKENYDKFAQDNHDKYLEGAINQEIYLSKVGQAILDNSFLDIKSGYMKRARRNTEKYLARNSSDPKAYFLMGEIERQDGGDNGFSKALSYYQKAIELNDRYPDPYQAIGILHLKKGDKLQAKNAFQQYLNLAENATNKGYIDEYIKECDQ